MTYGITLTEYFGVSSDDIGIFVFFFAAGNFFGCIVLGRCFDIIGRRKMIFFTYFLSSVLLFIQSMLFIFKIINGPYFMCIFFSVVFFFASAGASAAYLTISEIFPLEVRTLAIAFFYCIGTAVGGISGPFLYGYLIELKERIYIFIGYLIAVILMSCGSFVALYIRDPIL